MSEQENETPVWHAIVGEGWEPVQFGEMTKQSDEVLLARGWVDDCGNGGCRYAPEMRPRRRRKQPKIVVWRLCARPSAAMDCTVELKWIQSDKIESPWCIVSSVASDSRIEMEEEPFEITKFLPEGTSP